VDSDLKKILNQLNCKPVDAISLKVKAKDTPILSAMGLTGDVSKGATKKPQTTAFHLFFGVPKSSASSSKSASAKKKSKGGAKVNGKPVVRKLVVLEAKEVNGKIVSITEAHSK